MKTTLESLLPILAGLSAERGERMPLDAIADRAGRSPWHFQRTFTRLVGESPQQYSRRLRLEYGAARLLLTDDSVLDIALAVGFDSHEGFTRAFRQQFDCTPRRFRGRGREAGLSEDHRHARFILSMGPCLNLYRVALEQPGANEEKTPVSYDISFKPVEETTVLYKTVQVKHEEVASALAGILPAVFGYAMKNGVALVGPPFTRYVKWGPGMVTVEAGVPVAAGSKGSDEVESTVWPAREAAVTIHTGPYEKLRAAYAAIEEHVKNSDRELGDPPREIYLTDPGEVPDPANWQTMVVWPLA